MLRQIPIASDLTLAQCQAELRGIEARVGEVIDIVATTNDPEAGDQPENETLVTANRFSRTTVNSLCVAAEGDGPPAGTELKLAGTAWIAGVKTVVKIYR